MELDSVIQRSSSVNKSVDAEEVNKQVWATRQAFRHTSIDYMHAITLTQARKRHEIVDAVSIENFYSIILLIEMFFRYYHMLNLIILFIIKALICVML